MSKKMPPVPPANRSSKGPADDAASRPDDKQKPQRSENQGQTENIEQNTTNQGYQQDR